MERIALLPSEEQTDILESLTDVELSDYRMWLRPGQLRVVDDPAPIVVTAAGRGYGKTRIGATWCVNKAKQAGTRIHLVGRTVGDVRDVMVQGESGILAMSPPDFVPEYMPSVRRLIWPNGSMATTFSAESSEALRGPQSDATWADELATWRMMPDSGGLTAWDNIKISTRLGPSPQILVTTTPRRTRVIRELFQEARAKGSNVSLHSGSTLENRANLAPEYVASIHAMYAGTALEQQELHGLLIDEVAGALWRDSDIVIRRPSELPVEVSETMSLATVIGVDPGVTKGGDATGIVTVRGDLNAPLVDRYLFVRRDDTQQGLAPDQWAARVVAVWREETEYQGRPAIIVAEKNQGGQLVETVIRQTPGGEDLPIALVSAARSKAARAEPVILSYRRERVFHEADLPELVDEMTTWEPNVSNWSPNRWMRWSGPVGR